MSKDPAVLFYTSDFLTGTMTMKDEHVGMYIRLLCLQHQKGVLSKEDMLYICRTYVKDVFDKFIEKDGVYWNDRMKKESEKRQNYSNSRRENVKKRYIKESTYVEHMENENENINEDIIVVKKEGIVKGGRNMPPTVQDVEAYCKERNNAVHAQAFIDHYTANGWFRGKTKIKDWQACVRTWESNNPPKGKPIAKREDKPIQPRVREPGVDLADMHELTKRFKETFGSKTTKEVFK